MDEQTKNNTVNAVAEAVEELAADAEKAKSFGQFVAMCMRSRTILGLLVILAPLLARAAQVDPTVVEIALGTLIVLIGRLNPEIKPITRKRAKKPAPAAKVAAPLLLGAVLLAAGGCQDTPRTLDLRANRLVSAANASLLAARAMAPAVGVSKAEVRRVEREVILPALEAEKVLLDELDAAADAYTLAVASRDQAAIAAAEDRSRIAFNALLAVTNRLNQVFTEYQRQAATRPAR